MHKSYSKIIINKYFRNIRSNYTRNCLDNQRNHQLIFNLFHKFCLSETLNIRNSEYNERKFILFAYYLILR